MGVLSALPLVTAGNVCCCLWVVSGGVVAAYLLQQNQTTPMTAGRRRARRPAGRPHRRGRALRGCRFRSILLLAPMERAMLQRMLEMAGTMPPAAARRPRALRSAATASFGGRFFMIAAWSV